MTLAMPTGDKRDDVATALDAVARRLGAAGIESARLDARLLVGAVTGETTAGLIARPERRLTPQECDLLSVLLARRCAREPMAHILGKREFWSLEFEVSSVVLTPRPDSEAVIEAACRQIGERDRPLRVLDLGTGSGCLLLALLHEFPAATGVGIDISPAAAAIARRNAERLRLGARAAFVVGDWSAPVAGSFDLVVSNPPYIARPDIDGLEPEVARYEPRGALVGGPDGLESYRSLCPLLPDVLAPAGIALIELGVGQDRDVASLAAAHGLFVQGFQPDITGLARVAILRQG